MPADIEAQLRAVGRILDREVAHVDVDEVIGAATMLELETTTPSEPGGERHRSRRIVAAALAAAAAAVAMIVVLRTDDDGPDDDRVPSDTVPEVELLAPPADAADLVVTEAAHGRTAPGIIRAAVQKASGEIIGMTVGGRRTTGGGGIGGSKTIARHQVGITRSEVEDFWTYTASGGCFDVGVTVSDGLAEASPFTTTPEDIETFFSRLEIKSGGPTFAGGGTVTFELPPGWKSLGVARESDRYVLRFSANVDGVDAEFELDQRPATGVGVFLADPGRTNPRPATTLVGRPAWLMTGSDGSTTLVFHDARTAVSLRARGLDEDALIDFAATVGRRPWEETAALLAGTNPTSAPVEEQVAGHRVPLPSGCDVSLEVIPDDGVPYGSPMLFPEAGPLAMGEHAWRALETIPTPFYAFTISAPGWRSGGDNDVPGGGGWIKKGTPGTSDGAVITFGRLDRVYADPCDHTLSNPQASASDLAETVAAIPGIELISGPTPTQLGGDQIRFTGHHIMFRIANDIGCDPQDFYLWRAEGRPRAARELPSTITVSIIDSPSPINGGQSLFVEAETYKGASPELRREVRQIVDSFGPTGGGIG